ncbi:hypothetical protein BJF79_21495 [Actinomadura sp. CNU-125]|uniref:transposase n=1 Tax=Actinomadura sp. CNU-125 TaxID=1904961 RepID=UPI000967F0B8|nr:transposase [Actinomadura sp. CNU-125]OLT12787.1 hypothetical protein BJF79_21495 [Actinomadura sp. CNU-125]
MKLVVQVKLCPDAATEAALRETLHARDRAANHASRRAFDTGITGRTGLQRLVYRELKEMGLSAQPAIHAARKTAGAYATLAENLKAGHCGPQGARRRRAVEGKPVRFRKDAAQPFDDRSLSWRLDAGTVSIWTVRGRLPGIAFQCSPAQLELLTEHRRGESDLVYRGGNWYLYATCDIPEPDIADPANGFLGIDLGIVNIATTSDGTVHAGKHLNQVRHRNRRLRKKLQKKGTKSARRRLRHLAGREARFAANTDHCVSK